MQGTGGASDDNIKFLQGQLAAKTEERDALQNKVKTPTRGPFAKLARLNPNQRKLDRLNTEISKLENVIKHLGKGHEQTKALADAMRNRNTLSKKKFSQTNLGEKPTEESSVTADPQGTAARNKTNPGRIRRAFRDHMVRPIKQIGAQRQYATALNQAAAAAAEIEAIRDIVTRLPQKQCGQARERYQDALREKAQMQDDKKVKDNPDDALREKAQMQDDKKVKDNPDEETTVQQLESQFNQLSLVEKDPNNTKVVFEELYNFKTENSGQKAHAERKERRLRADIDGMMSARKSVRQTPGRDYTSQEQQDLEKFYPRDQSQGKEELRLIATELTEGIIKAQSAGIETLAAYLIYAFTRIVNLPALGEGTADDLVPFIILLMKEDPRLYFVIQSVITSEIEEFLYSSGDKSLNIGMPPVWQAAAINFLSASRIVQQSVGDT